MHHFDWIVVTVAILTRRRIERPPARMLHRALGAALGVVASRGLFVALAPGWGTALVAGGLAGALPWLRARHYMAYTVAATPLVLLFGAGRSVDDGGLGDRLVATVIGTAIALAGDLLAPRPPGEPCAAA